MVGPRATVEVEDTAELDRAAELPLFTPRRIVQTALVVVVLLVAIYFLFPKLVGLGDALSKLDDADPLWIGVAIGFSVARLRHLHRPLQGGRRRRRAAR